jgi:hypothetical protein
VLDRPLLARVDVRLTLRLEEEGRHISRQKGTRLGVHHVQSVVVDQHGLLLQPISPADLADGVDDLRADGAGERRTLKSFPRLSATRAANNCGHGRLQPSALDVSEPEE